MRRLVVEQKKDISSLANEKRGRGVVGGWFPLLCFNGVSLSTNRSHLNTDETIYYNGNFNNVDEVHNNTKNMRLIGFNQTGGKVTGNIENLEITSVQNKSTTTGSSSGIDVGVSSTGTPNSINVSGSKTNGNRTYVDKQSTFILGEGSNLTVGKATNTGAIVGTKGENSRLKIKEYTGKDLYNTDKLTTTGGSIGLQTGKNPVTGAGFNQERHDKEGITRNTVIGNVEIGTSKGSPINTDLSKANETTRDDHSSTNVYVEGQTIRAITNPEDYKNDIDKAKQEITDIGRTIKESVNDRGDDNRNFFGQLSETRLSETLENIAGERLKGARDQQEIGKALEDAYRDLGYKAKVIYTDPKNAPQLIGKDGKTLAGTAYVGKDGTHTILINTEADENGTRSGIIGTIAEEGSHIVGKVEGRQRKTGTEELGLESTGRATNQYFQDKYKDNDIPIKAKSDGKDYSSRDFGEHVGDSDLALKLAIAAGAAGADGPLPIGDIGGAAIIANELWEMYNEQSANQQVGKRKGTMWTEQRDFAKGKTKNERKSNPDKVESAKEKIETLRKEKNELKKKPNKTPKDKEEIKKRIKEIDKEIKRLEKSENHSMRGKGQQSKGGGNKR